VSELAHIRSAYDAIEGPRDGAIASAREALLGEIARGTSSGRSRTRRRTLAAVALASLVGALLVAPALGLGDRLLDLIGKQQRPPEVYSPVWSPDGRSIAYLSIRTGHEIRVMNADGTGERTIARNAFEPAWSPDGRWIAFSS